MIIVRADTRHATCTSDDAITTGSVGIPVKFMLSGQFNGLSAVAVFRSTGASVDVVLMSNTCVVPPEVLRASDVPLYIGVYARNSEGTVVIPTVWTATKDIQPGTRPSGVNPSEPTPDWTAQVQLAAQEAVQTSEQAIENSERAIEIAGGAQAAADDARQSANEAAQSATAAAASEAAARAVQESIPADYTDLSNDVSVLKSTIIATTALPPIWTDGKYVAGANVEINNTYYSIADFDVSNIETDVLISSFGSASVGWVLLSTTGSIISRSLFAGSTGDTYNYTRYVTVPANGKTLRVSCHTAEKSQQSVTYTTSRFEPLENDYCILSEFDNIFCAGDSLTWGAVYTGSGSSDFRAAKKPYNAILQLRTGAAVARNAQPGIDAIAYVGKLSSITEKTNQLVIIYLGTNGGLTDTLDTDAPGLDKSQYDLTTETGSYAYIVKHCLDVNAKVLLVKIYAGGGSSGVTMTNTVIGKVAEKFGVAVVENESLPQKYHIWPNGHGYDYTHLNDFGYAAFAEYLIRQVNAMDAATLARILPDS